MVWVVFWLICGGVSAMIASSKAGSGLLGFLAGALLGPLGIVVAFFLGGDKALAEKQLSAGERKKCPRCAELVQPDALVCKHCGHEFPAPEPWPGRAGRQQAETTPSLED